jgi:hypothetical protein
MRSKLNDTKRTILAGAASRTNLRVLPVPETVTVSEAMANKMISELLDAGLVSETAAMGDDVVWRETDDGRATLVITEAGLAAIGIVPGSVPVEQPASSDKLTKQDSVMVLLRRQQGASIEEMMAATGWQSHSVRGWMSGTAKKRLGLEFISEKDAAGVRRYHIAPLKSAKGA